MPEPLKHATWMSCPANADTDYPGLAYVCPLGELIIAEARDALHDVLGDRAKISYTIFNNLGQKIFIAVRHKQWKRFTIKIYNNYGNEVIELKRPFGYNLFVNKLLVWAPPGKFAGTVEQVCNKYRIKNESGAPVLKIRKESQFRVYSVRYMCGVQPIGVIKDNWADVHPLGVKNYGVSFPVHLDVRDKAILLGACFLIGCLKY